MPVKVLGINYGHNATVGLMEDGRLTFCQSEERFNRLKNSTGFPHQTLQYIYKNIASPEEIDLAVLYQNSVYGYLYLKRNGFDAHQVPGYFTTSVKGKSLKQRLLGTDIGWRMQRYRIDLNERSSHLQNEATAYFEKCLGLPREKIIRMDHHLSHAYSAIPNIQEWERTLVFTLDGVGDWKCATVNKYENDRLESLSVTDHRNSLGYLYANLTSWMGMKSGEHEFKVMGLAPYANPRYYGRLVEKLHQVLWVNDDGEWCSNVTPAAQRDVLTRLFLYERFDNIAGAIQQHTEECILKWIHYWIDKTGIQDIALAGGVFMNVKACQQVAKSDRIRRLFIVPSAGDETTVIGCCSWGTRQLAPKLAIQQIRDMYLGVEYGDPEIETAIRQSNAADRYEITTPDNINHAVARLLVDNHVVARCTGRMEFGARALGNRSILANPSRFENLQLINDAIKSRDFWMPFTPSILEEDMTRYVRNSERIFAPYMCVTFDATREATRDLAAAIHPRDHTLRPQCVVKSWNPDYYDLIGEFKRLTGIGGVLNTSFNLHGEPNVCSPQDAIRTVDQSGLRYLAMGRFLLKKVAATGNADEDVGT